MGKNDKQSEKLEKLNQRIAENPNDANAFLKRAIFYFFTKNDRSKTIDDLDKMVDVGNNTKNNMYGNRALFNFFMNKYNEALNDLNKADKIIYYIRGGCYYFLGKYNKAIQDFNKAIKLEPEFGWNFSRRGHCYYILDKYEKAINDFSKAIEINPKSELDYDYRGRCYFYIDKYEKAINDFSKAIEINPKSELHYDYRGRCYFYINKYDRANHDFNKVLGLNPEYKNEDMYLCYGDTLTCLEKFDEAIKNYKIVLEKDRKNETAKIGIAIAYYKIKKYDKIYKYLKNIDSFNIDDIGEENFKNLIEIIEFFEKNGDYNKAIDLYNRINPFDYDDISGQPLSDTLSYLYEKQISKINDNTKIKILELNNKIAKKEKEHEREKTQTKIQAQKDMMSFLTHTLNGALGTGQNTLKSVISDLAQEKNIKINELNRLTSLFSSFSLVTTMLDTFKIYLQDKNKFRENWKKDDGKDADIKLVLAEVLRLIFLEWFFVKDPSDRHKLLSGCGNFKDKDSMKDYSRKIKKDFIKEIIAIEIDKLNTFKMIEWFHKKLMFLDIQIKGKPVNFNKNNIRFGLFFSIFNEVITNSLKYSDGHTPIKIIWDEDNDFYIFKCINTTEKKHLENSFKSRKGLAFISHLMSFFEGKDLINYITKENLFEVLVKFPKNMFQEEQL